MTVFSVNKVGQDYDTFTAFEAAQNGDLVTATAQHTAELYSDDGALDDRFTVNGGTTNASYYLHFTSASEDRNSSYLWDATKARIEPTTTGDVIALNDNYTRVSHLQIKPNTGANAIAINMGGGSDYSSVYYNLIDGQEASTTGGVYVTGINTIDIYRNVIWGCKLAGYGAVRVASASGTFNVINNVMYNCDRGARDTSSGTFVLKNNAIFNNTTNFTGTFGAGSGYNGTDSASGAPGTGNVYSLTASTEFTNLTAGSEDFAVTASGSLYNSGNTSGAPYDTDIEGDVWSTGSIGADEYSTGGATITSSPASVARAETGVIIGISGGSATQGAATVTFGGESCTITTYPAGGTGNVLVTVPGTIALQHDTMGYRFIYTDNDTSTDTGALVPFNEPSGWDYINLVDPVTTEGSILYGYTGDVPVTGDQAVYTTPTSPDSITFTVGADGEWVLDTTPGGTQTVSAYVIQADGTVGTTGIVMYQGEITPSAGIIQFNGSTPTVTQFKNVTPATGKVQFVGNAAVIIISPANIEPISGGISFDGNVSTIENITTITPTAAIINFNGKVSTVDQRIWVFQEINIVIWTKQP